MTIRRSMLSLATLLAATALSESVVPAAREAVRSVAGKQPRPTFRQFFGMTDSRPNTYARECARRRGGQDWLDDRNFRRARRGLPALTR